MYAVTPVATLVSDPNCSRNDQKCLNGKLQLLALRDFTHLYERPAEDFNLNSLTFCGEGELLM